MKRWLEIVTTAAEIQHLDASISASVRTNASGAVTNWVDQSGFGNPSDGSVTYPSTNLVPPMAVSVMHCQSPQKCLSSFTGCNFRKRDEIEWRIKQYENIRL